MSDIEESVRPHEFTIHEGSNSSLDVCKNCGGLRKNAPMVCKADCSVYPVPADPKAVVEVVRQSSDVGGKKFDGEKPIMSLLPFVALKEIAKILTFGKDKYGSWNWAKGMDWSRVESAMLRHYEAYASGEDLDQESGLLHTAHMACNALFLLTYQLLDIGKDDRFKYD
jgi:hypothetical protein